MDSRINIWPWPTISLQWQLSPSQYSSQFTGMEVGVFLALIHSKYGLRVIAVGWNGNLAFKYHRGLKADQCSWGSVLIFLGFHPKKGCFEGFFCTIFLMVTSRTECTFILYKQDKLVYSFDNRRRNRMKTLLQRK